MRILLVDDNSESLYTLGALLQNHGYEVTLANNGVEAFEYALHETFNAIIADILMPQMDGLQLCRAIKTHERLYHIPYILYTATYIEPADEAMALSMGADKFVMKGRDPGVLLVVLQEVLRLQAAGLLSPTRLPIDDRPVSLQPYDTYLINHLEDKLQMLERLHRQLRESEERYRRLIDDANDAIVLIDLRGRVRFVNPKFCELTGYTVTEANNLRFSRLLPPEDVGVVMEYLWRRIAGEHPPQVYTFRWLTKAGRILDAEMNASVLVREGSVTGIQMIVRDITARRQVELRQGTPAVDEPTQLPRHIQQGQKMEAVSTLTAGIAHDFNNILGAILGYTELSMYDTEADSTIWHNLQEVLRAGQRGRDLVQHLLRFSRHTEQTRQAIDLYPLLQDTLRLLRASLPATITLEQRLRPDAGMVLADAAQIHQLCMHLCTNAIQAMRVAGGVLTIQLEAVDIEPAFTLIHPELRPGPHVRLTVRDTGHGMTTEILERIFEPFFTTKGVGEGIGLGLAIVHGIVTAHEGLITVSSVLGQGTTFLVYFPRLQASSTDIVGPEGPLPRGTERLLFVDDEVAVADMAQEMLERLGYSVTVCLSSLEALDEYRTAPQRFDLLITDQAMPQLTGEALAAELHRFSPQLPIILCTAFSYNMTAERAQSLGISATLMKPLIMHELAYTVRNTLDQQGNA